MPLFSVIVPVFNRAAMIGRMVESVLDQQLSDFEIIIVDDGSTDDVAGVLARYGEKIRVLRQQNSGPGGARNFGARHATGEYLVMFDSDDLLFPWALDTYCQVINEAGRPAFIAGCPFPFDREETVSSVGRGKLCVDRYDDYFAFLETCPRTWGWWGNSSFVLRRDVFEASPGYTTTRVGSDDCDLALKIGSASGFVMVRSPFTFAYRQHADGISKAEGAFARNVWHLIRSEKSNLYGGSARRVARQYLVAMFARPASLALVRSGRTREAWQMFHAILPWNIRFGRLRYLSAFPLLAARAGLRELKSVWARELK